MLNSMRFLICGVGSAGERHIRNLIALGHEDIAVFRTRHLPYRTLARNFPTYNNLVQALKEFRPDVAFVTNPTSLHVPTALECARAGCHIFVEKPISHNLIGLEELESELHRHGRSAMVGYMSRFHPFFRTVKEWLEAGINGPLGQPLFLRSSWGEHVPDWHPWEDYRESYAVRPELGGGPALTLSHDLDLAVWMLGIPTQVQALGTRTDALEARCEHAADFLLRFQSGASANLHLDYYQRPPQRSWELLGTRGRVSIDVQAGTMNLWRGRIGEVSPHAGSHQPTVETHSLPVSFERNQMFLDEVRFFLDCLTRGQTPIPGIADAAQSVRIALHISGGQSNEGR
jgi:predicted dehydrogenase